MKNLMIILLFATTICCSTKSKPEHEMELVQKYFSQNEIKELTHIISFVDSLVLANNKYTNIDSAYHYYLDTQYKLLNTGKLVNVAFDEELKYDLLFNIDSSLFEKIWIKSTYSEIVKTKDTVLYKPKNMCHIELNIGGCYMDLLRDLGIRNANYKDIYESCKVAGGLSASLFTSFVYQNKKYNFELFNDHMWGAIFLLTLEENVEEKVERYLKNQSSAHNKI
jgi:hypothetical protein